MLRQLDRAVAWALAGVRAVCIVQASALFLIVVLAVIFRYGFNRSLTWTEEVPRYLLIWISFLGAAAGVARRRGRMSRSAGSGISSVHVSDRLNRRKSPSSTTMTTARWPPGGPARTPAPR